MRQLLILALVFTLNFTQGSVNAQTDAATNSSPKLLNFTATSQQNKAILQWDVTDNENVYQFEVEKSTDGKTFTLTALVFSSEKVSTDSYMFYEKAGNGKTMYRLKMLDKDKRVTYSSLATL